MGASPRADLQIEWKMANPKQPINAARASRDGHEYHEAWTARKAMQLLRPDSDLAAIGVEGLSPEDNANVSMQTVLIADLTLYYGRGVTFEHASRTSIVQFKYSVSGQDREFRASQAKKTLEKFSKAYEELKNKHGSRAVREKLDFQIITNQPIFGPLRQAIDGIARKLALTGVVRQQAKQFAAAVGLKGKLLAAFASKCTLIGPTGSLGSTNTNLANLVVDWSATNDALAAARLGRLKQLVRDKAGTAGDGRNLITHPDILAALEIGDARDLLPCESVLVDVGNVVEREQLAAALELISSSSIPLLVHAAGGVGKTVFMDSLARKLADRHEVVFFDCFGGGAYRSPEDARHLARVGLIHIANALAFRGLCDPMLPGKADCELLYRTFRRRLGQCIDTLSRTMPGRELVLCLDAVDNAVIAANRHGYNAFPLKLLEMLDTEPVPSVNVIVSSRTERRPNSYAKCEELELRPFSKAETTSFLRSRRPGISQIEIDVAQARSRGNPRVLDYLVTSGRGLLDKSEIDQPLDLDELIHNRIRDALGVAKERGAEQSAIDTFLAGLAVLPPPVPIEEYAGAIGIDPEGIESFVADLFPLLERTNHGLTFRDEPTETLVRSRYASSRSILRCVSRNLIARQEVSDYAARALPGLLQELDDGNELFKLAFDERLPSTIKSTVGKRNIRYARLRAAIIYATANKNYSRLVRLLVELSTLAAADHRGVDYIIDHPDLVVASNDVDSLRRLFETRTVWPGTRHARLAIAYTLLGEHEEASRHSKATSEWINHHRHADHDLRADKAGPEPADICSIPLFLLSQGRSKEAAQYLKIWRDWYSYQVCECLFDYCPLLGC